MTNFANLNLESTPTTGQQPAAQNPALFNEGYPQSTTGAPTSTVTDASLGGAGTTGTAAGTGANNPFFAQLSSLPPESLGTVIAHLPSQDITPFFKALPTNDQNQLNAFMSQNPNAQGADILKQITALPAADLASALSALPQPDVQKAVTDAASGAGTSTAPPVGDTTGVAQTQTAGTSTDMTGQPPATTDTTGQPITGGAAYNPNAAAYNPNAAAYNPAAGADTSGQMPTGQAPTDASGQPVATASGDSAAKLSALSPADLAAVLSKLPPQDLAAFYKALPQADQQQLANALSGNKHATPQDLATVLTKLPQQDLLTAAGSVPANDLAQLLPGAANKDAKANPPGSGHSEFPLLFGTAAVGTAGIVAYKKGLFDRVPSMFENLTGRLDGHMPSWMGRFGGKGTPNLATDLGGEVPSTAATGLDLAEHAAPMADEAAALLKAGTEVGKAVGPLGDALEVAVPVVEEMPK